MSDINTPIPPALVEELASIFPEQSADLEWSVSEIWHKAGSCQVVRFMRAQLARQREEALTSHVYRRSSS